LFGSEEDTTRFGTMKPGEFGDAIGGFKGPTASMASSGGALSLMSLDTSGVEEGENEIANSLELSFDGLPHAQVSFKVVERCDLNLLFAAT
jgi:hypothetical protein